MSVVGIRDFMYSPYGLIADVKMLNFFRHIGETGLIVLGVFRSSLSSSQVAGGFGEKPATPRKSAAPMPAARAQAGSAKGFLAGRLSERASWSGADGTASRQAVHSTERMLTSLSTGSAAGHALAHLAQSMHGSGLRRIARGSTKKSGPERAIRAKEAAPEVGDEDGGQANTPRTISPVSPMWRKKLSIFTSAIKP